MIADYEKYNSAWKNINSLTAFRILEHGRQWRYFIWPFWKLVKLLKVLKPDSILPNSLSLTEDNVPRSGRWYNAGVKRTCDMLEEMGYKVIDPDICVVHRDPVIHFIKPV